MNILVEKLTKFYRKSQVTFILLAIMIIYFIFITLNGGTTNVDILIKYGALFPLLLFNINNIIDL